jgi:F-type H+-transporting ATPase subunit a
VIDRLVNGLASLLERYVLETVPALKKAPVLKDPRAFSIVLWVILGIAAGPILGAIFPPLKVPAPHVSLAAEPVLETGPRWLTNSLITTILVDLVILVLAGIAMAGIRLTPEKSWSNFMEWVVEGMYNLTESVAGHNAIKFFPWVMTIFLYVIISNYFGLLPGVGSIVFKHSGGDEHAALLERQVAGVDQAAAAAAAAQAEEGHHEKRVPVFRSPSADLNMTVSLALISVVMTQIWGVRTLGAKYFGKFFQNPFKNTMGSVVGLFELIAEISKIISFSFRLFGNIFAGEVVLAVMAFLVAFLLPMVFYGLEIFIGFIQALVFMLLTVAFFSMATISHDEHH